MQKIFSMLTALITTLLSMVGLIATPYDEPIDPYNGGDPCIFK